MKLTVKTLKGGKFQVDADPSKTVAEVKTIIEGAKPELPAATMKLIHSGKVLKDADTIASCNIKPNDFLVVMVTKAKKAPKPAAAATEKKEEKTEEKKKEEKKAEAPKTPAASSSSSSAAAAESSTSDSAAATTETPAPSSAPSAAPPAPSRPDDGVTDEAVSNLTAMGFPEAEVRACLRASGGNPDAAVEFLTNGIPPGVQEAREAALAATPAAGSSSSGGAAAGSGEPLAALRAHPQLNSLRRLVQSNPQMLQQVLTQIGQQNPELLAEINTNQAGFLALMNEPVTEDAAAAPSAAGGSGAGAGGAAGAMAAMGMDNPAQMAQMLQAMSPTELQSMAGVMGLTPEQLRTMAQMIGQMPPEQFREYMAMAMQGGGAGGLEGMMGGAGGAGGGGGGPGGPQVLRLNEEEMAAVDRLADMGFDRTEAAQAYLACDKNEALAANLLMDGGFADEPMGGGGGGGGAPGGGSGGNDDDEMYD